jgi:hypothetical protein
MNSFLPFNEEVVEGAEDFARDQAIGGAQEIVGEAVGGGPGKAIQAFTLDPPIVALESGQGASYLVGKALASDIFQNSLPSFLQSEAPGIFLMETLPNFLGSTAVGAGVGFVFRSTSTAPLSLDQVFGLYGNYDELAQRDHATQQSVQQMEQQYQGYLSALTMAERMQLYVQSMSGANTPQLKSAQTPSPAPKPRPCLGPGSCGVQ